MLVVIALYALLIGSGRCATAGSACSASRCSGSGRCRGLPGPPGACSTRCRHVGPAPGSSRWTPLAPLTWPAGGRLRPTGSPVPGRSHSAGRPAARVLGSGDRKGRRWTGAASSSPAGSALGAAVVTGGGGRLLQRRFDVADARADLALPRPADPAPRRCPSGADLAERGRRPHPAVHRQRRLLPGRHRDPRARRSGPADYRADPDRACSTARARFTLADLFDRDDVDRARHHADLRVQRGRRHGWPAPPGGSASRWAPSCGRTASGRQPTSWSAAPSTG